jgi:polyferredoxin
MKFPDVELPSNRKFGFFFTSVFVIVGGYFIIKEDVFLSYILLSLATLFFIVTLVKADFLLPLNMIWMKLGLLLGIIVSPIIIGLIYFGLFTPISLLMKLFGRDELRLNLKMRNSYWKIRNKDSIESSSFKHQF